MSVEKIINLPTRPEKKEPAVKGKEKEGKFNLDFLDDPEEMRGFMDLAKEISDERKEQETAKVDKDKLTSADLAQMNARERVEYLRQLKEQKPSKSLPISPEKEKANQERAVEVMKEMLTRTDVMAQIFGRIEAVNALGEDLWRKYNLDFLVTLVKEKGVHVGIAVELLDINQPVEKIKEDILASIAKYAINTLEVYQANNEKVTPRAAIRLPREGLEKISQIIQQSLNITPEDYEQLYAYAGNLKRDIQLQLSVELMAAIENSFLETEGLEDNLIPFQKEDKKHLLEILTAGDLQPENIAKVKNFIRERERNLSNHPLIVNIIKILEQMSATPVLKTKKNPAPWEQVSKEELEEVIKLVVANS